MPGEAFLRHLDEGADDIVAAGVDPIVLRHFLAFPIEAVTVIKNIPGTVYVCAAELVAIVPFPDCLIAVGAAIIFQEFPHLLVCEAKVLAKAPIGEGEYLEVIQACEDAFFGYAQAAGQDGKFQAVVSLERLAKQAPYQERHLVVVAMLGCFRQWHIVFVNQDDGFLAVVPMEQEGKRLQAFA